MSNLVNDSGKPVTLDINENISKDVTAIKAQYYWLDGWVDIGSRRKEGGIKLVDYGTSGTTIVGYSTMGK